MIIFTEKGVRARERKRTKPKSSEEKNYEPVKIKLLQAGN